MFGINLTDIVKKFLTGNAKKKSLKTMVFKNESEFKKVKPDFNLFDYDQISCHCCRKFYFDEKVSEFLYRLMAFGYSKTKGKLGITNLHRCKPHNQEIGGASASPHIESIGADLYPIDYSGMTLSALFSLAVASNLFTGVGIYTNGIIHVDIKTREEKKLYWAHDGEYKYFSDSTECLECFLKRKRK